MSSKLKLRSKGGKTTRHLLEQVKHKHPIHRVTFDPRFKGWLGPQKETPSKWAKARGAVMFLGMRNTSTRPKIDVASLVRATKNRMSISRPFDSNDNNLEATLRDKSNISGPFDSTKHDNAVWSPPKPIGAAKERSKYFSFDRPKTSDHARLSSAVNSHQAQYLKKILSEKDKELSMMQKLLSKSTEENSRLLKELEGYQGKNYDEIYLENIKLKESISRVSRENAVLRGQLLQEKNPAVQRMHQREREFPKDMFS